MLMETADFVAKQVCLKRTKSHRAGYAKVHVCIYCMLN